MRKKLDWMKSRTFWTGIVSILVWGAAEFFNTDLSNSIQSIAQQVMPILFILLGVTQRDSVENSGDWIED